MSGRKVCFIDDNGQVATCIRDDENCSHCSTGIANHYKWVAECQKDRERTSSKEYVNFYEKLHTHVHILEQTIYGLRRMSDACNVAGLEKISADLAWRANNIDEILEG